MNEPINDGRDPTKCPRDKTGQPGVQCGNRAGKGTNHKGKGPCYKHGGRNKNWDAHFEKEMAEERMRTYGAPIDTDPRAALLDEVQRTAGHVAWLEQLVGQLKHDGDGYEESIDDEGKRILQPRSGLKQLDSAGKFEKPSVWIEMYQQERQMLARVCKMALDAGIDERRIRVIEQQAGVLAQLVRGILDDLGLTPEQKAREEEVVRRNFAMIRGGAA